ncbi:MAG: hypothetical protein CSA70_11765 [Rhodobacterales bacterium]|nr:MAG: hypothetical protein CSA70_11765 [Rhodobacterales bacterium]
MAYLKSNRALTGPAANLAQQFADLSTLAALPGVSKLVSMHPAYVTEAAAEIVSVRNHANDADPFTQNTVGRAPVLDYDADLGRKTALFDVAQNRFMQSAAGFNWAGPHTVATVCRADVVVGDLFQSILGDHSAVTPDTASIVAQNDAGENRVVNRTGTLPGGAQYAKQVYGGGWVLIVAVSDGASETGISLNGGPFDRQTIVTMPSSGVTDFLLGHSVAGNGLAGAMDFALGVEGHDWSTPANASLLAVLFNYIRTAYGTQIPMTA